jgi:hypothetical protein
MNATAPQPLLSPAARIAGAATAVAIIGVAVAFAGRASEDAVHLAQAALSPTVRYITLEPVEVVVRRTGEPVACATPQSHV